MFDLLRRVIARRRGEEEEELPFIPDLGEGVRVYAIGDVHGRHDLLQKLMQSIIIDSEARGSVDQLRIIMLGDLIDRGMESAAVVDIVMSMTDSWPGMTSLMGNHEEMFLLALRGDPHGLSLFRRVGYETLLSYGVPESVIEDGDDKTLFETMMEKIPEAHRDFLAAMPNSLVIGEYLFVHAGIRPGVALEEQDERDLRWIRGKFLTSEVRHPYMVVHGHTISHDVDEQPNRIGIDTGAYASERLTAIGLEGTDRWYLFT